MWLIYTSGTALVAAVVVALTIVMTRPDEMVVENEPVSTPGPSTETSLLSETTALSTSVPPPSFTEPTSANQQTEPSISDKIEAAREVESLFPGIQANVNSIRNLYPVQEIETVFSTSEKLEELADTFFRRSDLRDHIFESDELFKALGLLENDADLEMLTRDLLLNQVYALFDDQGGLLYILSDAPELRPLEELAYASVYMAGLQEQLFQVSDIRGRARRRNFDEFRAVTGFVSGEVFQIKQGYTSVYFGGNSPAGPDSSRNVNLFDSLPKVVQSTVRFPEVEGGNFVAELYSFSGDWSSVNAVYESPPVSTEQIIHPDKYISGELPLETEIADVRSALGNRWIEQSTNTLGEFLIRTYLEEHLNASEASAAAAGWGGDQYTLLLGPTGESVFALLIEWDTRQDTSEFFTSYQTYASQLTSDTPVTVRDEGSRQWWIAPEQTLFIQDRGTSTILIIADNESLVTEALSAFQ